MQTSTRIRTLAGAVAVSLVAALASAPAQAEEGKLMVRVRAIWIDPADKSDSIPALGLTSKDIVDVNSKIAPDIDFEYYFGGHWSTELLLTVPQKHTVRVDVGGTKVALGSFKHLPPTLTLKYNFLPEGTFRPYVGAGINYTRIMDVKLAVPGATPLVLDLDESSFGFAVQAGFDVKLNEHWFASADVKYVNIESDVKIKANGTRVTVAKVDPMIWGVGFGYRF